MSKRLRLNDDEINHLKLEKKENNNRYSLNKDQLKSIYIYRGYDEGMVVEAIDHGLDPKYINHYWYKGEHYSLHSKQNNEQDLEQFAKDLIDELKSYAPKYPKIKRNKVKDGHLLVIDPADVHIGKLCSAFEVGEDYNQNIAVKRVKEGIKGILEKAKGFNIDKINFIGGNDILHIDTPHRKTTSGTPQDTDGMWYENFLNAKKVYIDALEMLLQVADVHFTFNPSNHDYISGFFLADVIKTHFRNCKNITFDCGIAHRKYFKYHNNLIGTTHGDGAKTTDLPLLMAGESKDWSSVKFRYIYTHHVHHKTSKDFQANVTVESLRSPSGTDSWHNRNGYTSKKAIEGFIHSKENGQVARLTHYF
jgi:hypothetical protein